MSAQKSWILPDHIHYIGCNDRLIVLALLLLTQSKQILDDSDQKTFLILLTESTYNMIEDNQLMTK